MDDENFINQLPDPLKESSYVTNEHIITLVHELTLGDILLSTLISILIVVTLLSRLVGGRR